ncbi:endospore germination permease [Ectobacillus sp. sgz5001026]|uniref:GerAB/ArcD/ProY family transporter n=1 Tax=Ectobacillus sp. sgz5001026 TaxID=3242473 RepID=UPI0036D223FB
MKEIKISTFQFFYLVVMFELGSASLLDVAAPAKQDGWIVLLISAMLGTLIYFVYVALYNKYPNMTFTGYSREIWGKYVGWLVGFVYVLYFIYIAARVLRDFEELLMISIYQQTSIFLLGLCMILTIMYGIYKGFEVFIRSVWIYFFVYFFILYSIIGLEIISGLISLQNIKPILGDGLGPVFKQIFPMTLTVPFGEMVAFTMLLPYLQNQKKARKIGVIAILVSGLLLANDALRHVAILGVDVEQRAIFPILTVVSYINYAGFIQRLEALVILLLVILGFVKISVFFFCAVIGLSDLFRVSKPTTLIYPVGTIIFISSIVMAPNYMNHIREGLKIVPYYLHIPIQFIIPCLLLLTAKIRGKKKVTP